MTKDRWSFILKNYKSDSTEDIRHFYSPVKLFLGGMDINVDSQNTKAVYEKEVKASLLSVTLIPLRSFHAESSTGSFRVSDCFNCALRSKKACG